MMPSLALAGAAALVLPGGLWETISRMDQPGAAPPPIELRICRAPAELAEDEPPPMLRDCSVAGVERLAAGLRRDYQCLGPQGAVRASVTYEGSPVTAWRLEQQMFPTLGRPFTLTMNARRLGDCPAGMAPGTMELPDGRRVPVPNDP
jgi:hypothetical protein